MIRAGRFTIVIAIAGLSIVRFDTAMARIVDPTIMSWKVNTTGAMGKSNDSDINDVVSLIDADVQRVRYDATNIYIESTGVPSHNVGPFGDGNPAVPSDRSWLFQIPRTTPSSSPMHPPTPLSSIGMFVNGVPMYNMSDATSYEDEGYWNNNAIVARADGMDNGNGHPSPNTMMPSAEKSTSLTDAYEHTHSGMDENHEDGHTHTAKGIRAVEGSYHYHQQPPLLRNQLGDDGTGHSLVLGYAYDGFPVYGPYGYANTNGTGGITRIESSYALRSISDRSTLPDGTNLAAQFHGPAINATCPLGYFMEDFEYVSNSGDLDEYNGRTAVTPEYPGGVYAYYATIDGSGDSQYPFLLGENFYGQPINANIQQTVSVPGGVSEFDYDANFSSSEVWVDFSHTGVSLGSETYPHSTIIEALKQITAGGIMKFKPGSTTEVRTIQKDIDLQSTGTVQLGTASAPEAIVSESLNRSGFVGRGRQR